MLFSLLSEGFTEVLVFGVTHHKNSLDKTESVARPGFPKRLPQARVCRSGVDEDQKRSWLQATWWLLEQTGGKCGNQRKQEKEEQ